MNEAKIYADGFTKSFAEESEFLKFLKSRKENTAWKTEAAKSLRFEALKEDEKTEKLLETYKVTGKEAVIEDTLANTKLMLQADGELYPVRSCALNTILERAKISGNALSKLERPIFAKILNHCLRVADGKALFKVCDDKVSAVHGGDKSDYSVLEMHDLFIMTANYLTANFTNVQYMGGFFDHSMVTAIWSLPDNEELVETYCDLLGIHGIKAVNILPSVRLTTSDVGLSGANLYPTLLVDGRNIPLGSTLKLEHKNGASLCDFENKLSMLYSQYSAALGKLSALLTIDIHNPENCMMGVMKKIGVPKKLAMEAIETFKAKKGVSICNAHDIYYGIAEVIFMMQCENQSGIKITQMEENVSRALTLRWTEYDIPGQLKW